MEFKLASGIFSGKALEKKEVSNLILVESIYRPNLKLTRHSHENACFCLVLEGSFDDFYGKKQRSCKPATLFFRPPDESHADNFHNVGTRCFNIEIKPNLMSRAQEYAKVNNESVELFDKSLIAIAKRLYYESHWMDDVSQMAIEGLSLEMLANLSRHLIQKDKPQPPVWLKKVRDVLQAEFTENLSLSQLSASVGIHPSHISRSFHRYYRCTIADYVRQLRIDYACRQMSKPGNCLSQIALDAGFAHQSHFSNTFKRLTGLTPGQYRLNHSANQ